MPTHPTYSGHTMPHRSSQRRSSRRPQHAHDGRTAMQPESQRHHASMNSEHLSAASLSALASMYRMKDRCYHRSAVSAPWRELDTASIGRLRRVWVAIRFDRDGSPGGAACSHHPPSTTTTHPAGPRKTQTGRHSRGRAWCRSFGSHHEAPQIPAGVPEAGDLRQR